MSKKQGYHLETLLPILKKKEGAAVNGDGSGNGNGIRVAIELNLREGQVNKFFREFWKLKNLDELYEIYPQIEYCLPSFLKLHKALKKRGLNPQNTESFVDIIELGVVKLPELQDQYQKLQDKVQGLRYNLQDMQYRKQGLERYLQATQKRINELTDAQNTLQQTFDLGAEKVSNLYKEKYWLEQSIASHKNSNKE